MDLSNGYLSIPITAQYQLNDKIELFAGASLDMLLIPNGRGTIDFEEEDGDYFFLQTLIHNYRQDEAGELHDFVRFNPQANLLTIDLNDEKENLYSIETAYQNLNASFLSEGKKYRFFVSSM